MSLIKSSLTIGAYTMISRVLGFVRDMTIAAFLGASWLSDAFLVAFKIPNFLRRLFAEGAFNAAFVPMFSGMLAVEGNERARAFASDAMSFLVTVLIALSIVCVLAMPYLMFVLAPGFVGDAEKYNLTVLLTRITFPYIIFISIVSLLGGVLNSFSRFAAVASTPIIMNLCLIIVPIPLAPYVPTYAHALAIAVFVAGVAQMLWLIYWCMRLKIMPRLKYPAFTAEVKKMFRLIAPAAMGAGVAQINLFIDLIIASHIAGGVSYLYYADRINELPLAIIGIAVGTALLPMLSRQIREGKLDIASHSQNRAIEFALLFALPAAAALVVMAEPVIHVLYERGQFTAADTLAVTPALVAFACGLPAFILIKVLAPCFYANQDTKTPFVIATICIGVNLLLNLALIGPFKHVGMAMATTTAGWLNVWLMTRNLKKRKLLRFDAAIRKRIPKMLFASGGMMAGLIGLAAFANIGAQDGIVMKALLLALHCAIGAGIYFALIFTLKVIQPQDLKAIFRRAKAEKPAME